MNLLAEHEVRALGLIPFRVATLTLTPESPTLIFWAFPVGPLVISSMVQGVTWS